MSHRKWKFRIRHILDAISHIQEYTRGMNENILKNDPKTLDAVIRNFQVIGEATKLVPAEVRERYPQVPWTSMRSMRNVIVHAYDQVKVTVIWQTIQGDLPPLYPLLRRILEEEPGE